LVPRGANDCLSAANCIELDELLLQLDRDFAVSVRVEPGLQAVLTTQAPLPPGEGLE
jgi:hypothetical protein